MITQTNTNNHYLLLPSFLPFLPQQHFLNACLSKLEIYKKYLEEYEPDFYDLCDDTNFVYIHGYTKGQPPTYVPGGAYTEEQCASLKESKPKITYDSAIKYWNQFDLRFSELKVDECGICMCLKAICSYI
jgi:hypothetical protein